MNREDIFKEQLKSVFGDFEAPLPHDGWEKIEQSLNAIARAKIIRRNWYMASAASVVAILLGTLFFMRAPQTGEQNIHALTEIAAPTKPNIIEAQKGTIAKTESTTTTTTTTTIKSKSNNITKSQLQRKGTATLLVKQTMKESGELPVMSKIEQPEIHEVVVAEQMEERRLPVANEMKSKKDNESTLSWDEIDRLVREFANAGNADVFSDFDMKDKKPPLMLALNAKGGLVSSQKTTNTPMTLRSAAANQSTEKKNDAYLGNVGNSDPPTDYSGLSINAVSIADNVAKMEHAQPFSVGFTVSKNIIDRLSVETGLVYTYLFSKAKNMNIDFRNQETQHFYYLGIPINLNYNFLDLGKLGLFASVGGMIEKDIYGKRKYQARAGNKISQGSSREFIIERIKQDNLQFSVNAGVGAVYPVYRGFNLYGKMGGSYYFDTKNNYMTIYSDKKIVLDLSVGIRFDF